MNINNHEKDFDQYHSRLNTNIYNTLKGKIRLKILSYDLDMFLSVGQAPLSVLDAGCGFGQCSSLLASNGHRVTLCDISSNMIDGAKKLFSQKGIENVDFIKGSILDHSPEHLEQYDLVLCHAVIEWTNDPKSMLNSVVSMIKPGGYLSLMFFNRDATILKAVLRGNFFPKDSGFKFGRTKSLTPINPLNPQDVYKWIDELGLKVIRKSGIRVFYDYCDKTVRDSLNEEQVLACELSFSRSEPYLSMGRYIHLLCQFK